MPKFFKVNEMDRKEINASLGENYTSFGREVFLEVLMEWDGYTLDEIVARVEEIRKDYSDKFKDIRLDKSWETDYDGEQRTVWKFVGKRMETEKEYNTRIEQIKQREAENDARDRIEFERLKAKFG